jgi:uncharacterized membrane protein YvbJ
MKPCPECECLVEEGAWKCRHCGKTIGTPPAAAGGASGARTSADFQIQPRPVEMRSNAEVQPSSFGNAVVVLGLLAMIALVAWYYL